MKFFSTFFSKPYFFYPEMKPKDRFLRILEEQVAPKLQSDGFTLYKSSMSFKKQVGDFSFEIEFRGSKWNNTKSICEYNPHFSVKNKQYKKWVTQNFNPEYPSELLISTIGNHSLPLWKNNGFTTHNTDDFWARSIDFAKYDNCKLIDHLIQNIKTAGYSFFEHVSSVEGIKNYVFLNEYRMHAPMLIDLCQMYDKREHISEIFEWYDNTKENPAVCLEEEMIKRKNITK